uniref:Uncharacterized protein n=1 Tax=Lactuca sativa TaxID=4236 RepID=A0A9R1W036_LACSA|nr:hypothetical protein LSAT_V11C300131520 [Lactuca sativa]
MDYTHLFLRIVLICIITTSTVVVSREIISIHQFFKNLIFTINVVCASSKGLSQVGTLRRASDTRWSSHVRSFCSFLNMFDCTRVVL